MPVLVLFKLSFAFINESKHLYYSGVVNIARFKYEYIIILYLRFIGEYRLYTLMKKIRVFKG